MLQFTGSQRVRIDLVTEQQQGQGVGIKQAGGPRASPRAEAVMARVVVVGIRSLLWDER